jgi:hypothetical protein
MQFHSKHIPTVLAELEQFATPEEKLHHLINEKRRFGRQNSSTPEVDSILRWYDDTIMQLRFESQNITQSDAGKRDTSKTHKSFRWIGTSEKLTEMYNKMKGTLITEHTLESDYNAIFNAEPLSGIVPLCWTKSQALLAYYIYRLSSENNTISMGDNQWVIAECCFSPAKNLRQTNNNRFTYGSLPRNHQLVDDLF